VFAHAEEAADADDEGGDLSGPVQDDVIDVADLLVPLVVDVHANEFRGAPLTLFVRGVGDDGVGLARGCRLCRCHAGHQGRGQQRRSKSLADHVIGGGQRELSSFAPGYNNICRFIPLRWSWRRSIRSKRGASLARINLRLLSASAPLQILSARYFPGVGS
jgi:hypothetical protein